MKQRRPRLLGDIGEGGIIDYIRSRWAGPSPAALTGPGDDAALVKVPGGKDVLATTDLMIEDVHFNRNRISPRNLGYKAAAVNVSDIAAMGGRPVAALLACALPANVEFPFVTDFWRGVREAEKKFGFRVVGGDTTTSPARIFINITLLGVPAGARPFTRAGAKPGDRLYVTGHLGASHLGWSALTGNRQQLPVMQRVVRRHLRPDPPLPWAIALARKGLASAAIDLSDGLSTDLGHLCRESGTGVHVFADTVPIRPSTRRAADRLGQDALEAALHGGEEYELLFTVSPGNADAAEDLARRQRVKISLIGRIRRQREGITLLLKEGKKEPLRARGWQHFTVPE